MLKTVLSSLCHDRFLHLLLVVGAALALVSPAPVSSWWYAVDWRTITTLAGLLMLTRGIEHSGCFELLGQRLVKRFATQRHLALFLLWSAALLSTFLTNDVALFIVVPLTLTLRKWCAIPIARLIIIEALAVNAGSLLTPIGNPQNILLWGYSGLSFFGFIGWMAPLALLLMVSLSVLVWVLFPPLPLHFQYGATPGGWQPRIVAGAVLLYVVFIIALESPYPLWAPVLVAAGFLIIAPRVPGSIDWSLLLVFIVMFVDVHLFTQIPFIHERIAAVTRLSPLSRFLAGIGFSQIISNVPSTILLLNYIPADKLLAWAVNIGGFGLLPGSLANIIALRMAADRRIWWRFHLYSVPVLIWSVASGYLLLHWLSA